MDLREYQREALDAIAKAHANGVQRAAVVLPTGSGKTVIFSHLCREWIEANPGRRVLILVHRDELATQTVEKLAAVAPHLRVGIVKAKQNEHVDRDVVVASVQTVRNRRRLDQISDIGTVIVDECHHASAASYVTVMTNVGCYASDSGVPAVGFTATLARNDSKSLSAVWERVVYRRDIMDMITDGFLSDVRGRMVTVNGLSLSEVTMSGGDYALGSLSDALMGADAPAFVADAYVQHATDRPGIVFTPTVATALEFAKELNRRGIRSAPVYGAMDDVDRRQIMSLFRDGQIQVLVNCMVLTEGFDAPRASCVVIARPTTSPALYVQMVGRVLRPYPGKDHALVLDVVGASQEHKLASLVDLSSARVGPMKPGESLTEAIARQRAERNPHLNDYAIAYQDVNLFEVAEGMWLRTKAGILFITTRDDYYFIWPGTEKGRYHVGTMPKFRKGGGFAHKNVSLEFCKKWAEDQAIEADPTVAKRKATWRTKRQEPTENMISFAKQIGLRKEIKPGMTRRELSSMMDIHMASKKLDKAITKGDR